jgi:hypothetical protein
MQLQLVLGDVFGYVAITLIIGTAVLMLLRRTLLRHTKNLDLLRHIHLWISTAGGGFLVLHVAYFISYPVTSEILIGYVSAAIALVVWVTGTTFLERFRDSLFYHGSMSLVAIGMMVVHAASAGLNIPVWAADSTLLCTAVIIFWRALRHVEVVFPRN